MVVDEPGPVARAGFGGASVLSARRSPRRGRSQEIFARLVSLPALLTHPRFEVELLLTHEEEYRRHEPGQAFHRHGWVVVGRSLLSIDDRILLSRPLEAAALLPSLPELLDTSDLARAADCTRRLAQQMTYCLRAVGVVTPVDNRGRAVVYRLSSSSSPSEGDRAAGERDSRCAGAVSPGASSR